MIEEWEHIKLKVKSIQDNANIYHTIGSTLIGVAGSALVAALTLDLPINDGDPTPMPIVISWFIFASALLCGFLALFFGRGQRKVQNSTASDVVAQMELIEKRYEEEKHNK